MRVLAMMAGLALAAMAPGEAEAGACGELVRVTAAGPLARDALVLLEVSGDADELERLLPAARLVGAGASVPVRVVRTVRGGRTQVLLAADGDLPPDAVVHLQLGEAELDARLADVGLATGVAPVAPVWSRSPAVGKRTRVPDHKGDSSDTYAVRVGLPDGALVLATLTADAATAEVIYPVSRGAVAVGRTGCHSVWSPSGSRPFTVELRALGPAGHDVPAPGKPLRLRFR